MRRPLLIAVFLTAAHVVAPAGEVSRLAVEGGLPRAGRDAVLVAELKNPGPAPETVTPACVAPEGGGAALRGLRLCRCVCQFRQIMGLPPGEWRRTMNARGHENLEGGSTLVIAAKERR